MYPARKRRRFQRFATAVWVRIYPVTCLRTCGRDRPVLDGINDVEECVTALIRTDKSSISLNGAWAQNINKTEMYVDFWATKAGIRLDYGNKFTLYTVSGGMLQEIKPDYNIPDMYKKESEAFFRSVETGKKNKGHIDRVIETARIMDAIYESAQKNAEVRL